MSARGALRALERNRDTDAMGHGAVARRSEPFCRPMPLACFLLNRVDMESSKKWPFAIRPLSLLLSLALAAGCRCGPPCHPNESGKPTPPLTAQGLGDPCYDTSSCADALECMASSVLQSSGPMPTVCTTLCTSASDCPAGADCMPAGFAGVGNPADSICLPTCASDDDCRTSTRAGRCDVLDAAATRLSRVCHPLDCFAGQCPIGFECVEMTCWMCEGPGVCPSEPSRPGWCRASASM